MENHNKKKIYLLLDTSSSMIGEPIEAIKQSIKVMIAEWQEVKANIEISVIVYATIARECVRNMPLQQFSLPHLILGGLSFFEKACHLLYQCLEKEKQPNEVLVFLFTDGNITKNNIINIQQNDIFKKVTWIVCGAGAEADISGFEKMTKHILILNTLTYGEFQRFL